MESVLTKGEKAIAIILLLVISLVMTSFSRLSFKSSTTTQNQIESKHEINYTMARPESVYSEYNLDGREQERTYEGLPPSVNPSQNSGQLAAHKPETKKLVPAANAAEAKKKEEAKKKQAEAAKAQTAKVDTKLQENTQTAQQVQDPLVSSEAERTKTDPQATNSRNNINQHNTGQAAVSNPNVADPNADQQNQQDANKKTFTQWRTLLFEKPTPENLALFITALHKNEITNTEYQAMAQDLVDQNDSHLKSLGLMALRAAPSFASLSQLVHLEPAKLGSYQQYAEQSLNAYLQPQNIQYLNQALLTKDKKLIVKSLMLLSLNLTKFSQGDFTGMHDSRSVRSGEVTKFSMTNYKPLLPALAQLSTSSDPELSGMAQQTASLIQSYNTIAQN